MNRSVPVRAIVMLEQARHCELRRLGVSEAFRRLYAGMTVNSWNNAYVTRTVDLSMELAADVPVYHLACTPTKDAVLTLQRELEVHETGFERGSI